MGIRGELYTTHLNLDNRSYFFNVKENRNGDIFLQMVESKNGEGTDASRHQIAVFEEDLQNFLKSLDVALSFIKKEKKNRDKLRAEKKAMKEAKFGHAKDGSEKKVYRRKTVDDGVRPVDPNAPKKTGRIHVVSKRDAKPKD